MIAQDLDAEGMETLTKAANGRGRRELECCVEKGQRLETVRKVNTWNGEEKKENERERETTSFPMLFPISLSH